MRIVQVSDTHITHRGGASNENLRRLVTFINERLKPDLVVYTGDLGALAPSVADLKLAHGISSQLEAPFYAVPGNHDIGEAGERAWMGLKVSSATIAQFRKTFGDDHWLLAEDDDWAVLGFNDEILGSGIPEEQEQWEWLERSVPAIGGRSVVIFLHKPLWSPLVDGGTSEHAMAVEPEHTDRLLGHFLPGQVRAIGSGHLHRYRQGRRGDILEVWAPATAFVAGDQVAKMGVSLLDGLGQLGVVEYNLEDGVKAWFRGLPDLPELEMTDIPELKAELDHLLAQQSQGLVGTAPAARPGA